MRIALPAHRWAHGYSRSDLNGDVSAGLTIGAMLVPQAMAYALLAGLPPQVGLYAATLPVLVYALLGTSRQLAVGPVAIVSLLTATALGELAPTGTTGYLAAAALLALLVGLIHVVLGVARLGWVVNFLSHSVLVGFTSAAAVIIGLSQVKHLLGVQVPRSDHIHETLTELARELSETQTATVLVGLGSIATIVVLRRVSKRLPGALIVVVGATIVSSLANLPERGVQTVGNIPSGLPGFALPDVGFGVIGDLAPAAGIITLIGFVESIAVAKVYARRHRYEIDPNTELIALGSANVVAGITGGYPVGGGFARTAVNDAAGARTPLASVITAGVVLAVLAFFTPLFQDLPQAALAGIIIVAVRNLIDVAEIRHIVRVKRSDAIGMGIAAIATLVLGIELGIAIAVISSMLVVFARMSRPHTAVLGRIQNTTSYRNLERFPNAIVVEGITVIRVDAAVSFINAQRLKNLLLSFARSQSPPDHLVLDCSGINDLDATGADALSEIVDEFADSSTELHLCDVKGPVRDVLHRAGLWGKLSGRIHSTAHAAVEAIQNGDGSVSLTASGIDEPRIGS
jgi:SulP family sulfate permease